MKVAPAIIHTHAHTYLLKTEGPYTVLSVVSASSLGREVIPSLSTSQKWVSQHCLIRDHQRGLGEKNKKPSERKRKRFSCRNWRWTHICRKVQIRDDKKVAMELKK